jgi:hypothetical protein
VDAVSGVLGAFGLSGAAGLNAYIPLFAVSVLGRTGVIHLGAPFDVLTHTWAIALISVLLVVELVVDKIPGADHVNDLVQTVIRPAAGALVFAASTGAIKDMHPAVPVVLGLLMALSVHAAKATARPVVNATTLGVGAPVVSIAEDLTAAAASVVALLAPILVLVVAVLAGYLAYRLYRRAKRRKQAKAT